eukprot:scaffold87878_cov54-Phaeocystis_antarctica.AAC.4
MPAPRRVYIDVNMPCAAKRIYLCICACAAKRGCSARRGGSDGIPASPPSSACTVVEHWPRAHRVAGWVHRVAAGWLEQRLSEPATLAEPLGADGHETLEPLLFGVLGLLVGNSWEYNLPIGWTLRCGEREEHVDAPRRRRRAHRLKEAAAAAAACEQLSPRHADGRDADLGYIGLQGGCILPPLTHYDCLLTTDY